MLVVNFNNSKDTYNFVYESNLPSNGITNYSQQTHRVIRVTLTARTYLYEGKKKKEKRKRFITRVQQRKRVRVRCFCEGNNQLHSAECDLVTVTILLKLSLLHPLYHKLGHA